MFLWFVGRSPNTDIYTSTGTGSGTHNEIDKGRKNLEGPPSKGERKGGREEGKKGKSIKKKSVTPSYHTS